MDKVVKYSRQKKWVMLLGYSGRDYYGMQYIKRGQIYDDQLPTIESELFKALSASGVCTESELTEPQSALRYQRAARTDRGVSAVRQIVSLKLTTNLIELLPALNRHLPECIRVFAARPVTKHFDSRTFCDARTYSYLLPTYALCPLHRVTDERYRVTNSVLHQFNTLLHLYQGNHQFHNFTSGYQSVDCFVNRSIHSFECSEPFVLGGDQNRSRELEFVVARVKGESFILHQIRKMIGTTVMVMRGFANPDHILRAFDHDKMSLPIAPGLGLLLEQVHYDWYNSRFGGNGQLETLHWDPVNADILEFKLKHIYSSIVDTEIRSRSMLKWLANLPLHGLYRRKEGEPLSPMLQAMYRANPQIVHGSIEDHNQIEVEEQEFGDEQSSDDEFDDQFEGETGESRL